MYTVRERFTDLQDNGYDYAVGDTYPRKGYTPTEKRIKALTTNKNVRKRPLIEAVATVAATVESPDENVEEDKPTKRRKKREE